METVTDIENTALNNSQF